MNKKYIATHRLKRKRKNRIAAGLLNIIQTAVNRIQLFFFFLSLHTTTFKNHTPPYIKLRSTTQYDFIEKKANGFVCIYTNRSLMK